jgi:hypothetical protein
MSNMENVNFQGGNRVSAVLSLMLAVLKLCVFSEVINLKIKENENKMVAEQNINFLVDFIRVIDE